MNFNFCPRCGTKSNDKVKNNAVFICSSVNCDFQSWNNPTPVAASLLETPHGIVLARNKTWPENMYGLITGFVEFNEHPEETALREAKEELGVDASIVSFLGFHLIKEFNQLLFGYHLKTDSTELNIGDELAEIKFIPQGKLKPWNFGTGYVVRDYLDQLSR